MDRETRVGRLCGCYVTIPTMFRDGDLALDVPAVRRHVKFLLDGGIETGNAVLLAGGAAGDFSTMSFDERVALADAVVQEVEGRVPVILGAQTTSTAELVELTKAAERVGAEYVQVSPPYYFEATEGDFYEYIVAASEAADIGIIIYNTFWTEQQRLSWTWWTGSRRCTTWSGSSGRPPAWPSWPSSAPWSGMPTG